MTFKDLCEQLEIKIIASYEAGVTLNEAEKLASEFLYGMMAVSKELKKADLDSRLRKSGVKAIRASIYLHTVQTAEKKPTEGQLTAMLDADNLVAAEQHSFDEAEVDRDDLERYYNIFSNAHVHFRGIAKGRFD